MRAELTFATIAALLFATTDAGAFCRTRTVPAPADFSPNGASCFDQGAPLYHPSQCVPYRIADGSSAKVPTTVLSEELARAFAAWTGPNAHCTPGISTIELAPVKRDVIASYKTGQRGDNIVGFVQPWKHSTGETLALATLTFDANSGEIYDVDLEVNDEIAWSTAATPAADGFDLESALTHEAGHVLGLAHSSDVDATMFASYTPGSVAQRTLADDDMRGVCDVYPTRFARSTAAGTIPATECRLAPGNASDGCGDAQIVHGCAAAPIPGGGTGAGAAFVVLAISRAASWRRRRAARR